MNRCLGVSDSNGISNVLWFQIGLRYPFGATSWPPKDAQIGWFCIWMGHMPCRENKVMTTPPSSAACACLLPIGWTISDGVKSNRADTIDDCYRVRPQPTGNSIGCLPLQFVNILHLKQNPSNNSPAKQRRKLHKSPSALTAQSSWRTDY